MDGLSKYYQAKEQEESAVCYINDSYLEALNSVERLEAENAKLREDITRLEQANIVLDSDNCDLRNDMKDMQFFIAENAKLRELVRDMLRTLGPPALRVDEIECGTIYAAHIHAFEDRMKELGMEVDG